MDGNEIRGIITESKSGREAILAKRIIDATGDADVAARAGAPYFTTPKEEMMAASVMFSMSGVDKHKFIEAVKADPQTYKDWEGGEWTIETTGKEDAMFSPFLRKPFQQAIEAGMIPKELQTICGTWGTVSDQGDLTYLNLVHLSGCDGTDADDLSANEIEGRRQAMLAINALREFTPGCENAKLRNFGMTIGIRDTRKIDAEYNMVASDVREQGRFDDSIGIFLNDEKGGFTKVPGTPDVGLTPLDPAVGDFNGDGFVDLAVPNFVDKTVKLVVKGEPPIYKSPLRDDALGTLKKNREVALVARHLGKPEHCLVLRAGQELAGLRASYSAATALLAGAGGLSRRVEREPGAVWAAPRAATARIAIST